MGPQAGGLAGAIGPPDRNAFSASCKPWDWLAEHQSHVSKHFLPCAVLKHQALRRTDRKNSLGLHTPGRVKELNVMVLSTWRPHGMEIFRQQMR